MGENPVKNDAGQLSLDEEAKKLGESIMSVFSTLSSLGIQKTYQRKAQLKAQVSQSPWRWSQRPSAKWHLAKQPDHQVLSLRCWSPLGKLAQWRCVISLRTSSRRDAFQLTGRKASLSICTRAKEMLWKEATTGAWSWLSKWWRCWSVWLRDSSGKELRSMRCSVASCLAVALLMQFLLYVSYRRSTWLPTSRSTWPSSTWRKHLIEFHVMSSGGQCAN